MPKILHILAILILVIAGTVAIKAFLVPYILANLSGNATIEKSVIDIAKKSIVVMQTPSSGLRSGLVISEDGLVVALGSVVGNKKNVIPGYIDGDQVSLKNLHMSNDNVALLRMTKSGLIGVKFANEADIKVGQKVFLVAAASYDHNEWIIKEGTITHVSEGVIKTDLIGSDQVSSAPLFNASGELVGIVYLDDSSRIIATPVNQIRILVGL